MVLRYVSQTTQKFKTMVTIINFKERQKEEGTSFYVLEVQGGIEMIKKKKHFISLL